MARYISSLAIRFTVLVVTVGTPLHVHAQFPEAGAGFASDAPATIYTQVAYSDENGMLVLQHVLRPGPFFTSDQTGIVYRFRDNATGQGCPGLKPVFADGTVLFDDTPAYAQLGPGLSEADQARRSITEVVFRTGCPTEHEQPRSTRAIEDLEAAGVVELVRNVDLVNVPSVPSPDMRRNFRLWEGPANGVSWFDGLLSSQSIADNLELTDIVDGDPQSRFSRDFRKARGLPGIVRPRLQGWSQNREMYYVTYETCSNPTWSETGFCQGDGISEVFITRGGSSIGATGMTNIVSGVPFPRHEIEVGNRPANEIRYSPIVTGLCAGGNWVVNMDRVAKFEGTDAGVGFTFGRSNCFGPTPQEVKDFTSRNEIVLPGEIFPSDDPRHGGQIRNSADFFALEGMNGFSATPTPWIQGKVKIVNSPVIAVDLNRDRQFESKEFIAFPDFVLETNRDGAFSPSLGQ